MEVECFEIKLKPGAVIIARQWAERLKIQTTEFQLLLKDEGITLESVFLKETPKGASLIYHLRGADLNRARKIAGASQHPLDQYHRLVMNQISESSMQLECLFDVSAD